MRARTLNRLAIAVALLGLVWGPGYLGYCWFVSGSAVATRSIPIGQPLSLQLSPEMNPIRFVVAATFRSGVVSRRDRSYYFDARLEKDARIVWKEQFVVTQPGRRGSRPGRDVEFRAVPRAGQLTSPLRTFSIDRPGEYTLTVTHSTGGPRPTGVRLHLHVREKVESPRVAIVVPGFLALLAGAGVWYLTRRLP